MLAIQFEEEAYYQLQERDKWKKQNSHGVEPDGGNWRTDDTVGDDDEEDWFDAE